MTCSENDAYRRTEALLYGVFMFSANASVLYIIAPPAIVFTAQHPANASALHVLTRPLSHHNLVTNRFM